MQELTELREAIARAEAALARRDDNPEQQPEPEPTDPADAFGDIITAQLSRSARNGGAWLLTDGGDDERP